MYVLNQTLQLQSDNKAYYKWPYIKNIVWRVLLVIKLIFEKAQLNFFKQHINIIGRTKYYILLKNENIRIMYIVIKVID